jgi:hypothetical protein
MQERLGPRRNLIRLGATSIERSTIWRSSSICVCCSAMSTLFARVADPEIRPKLRHFQLRLQLIW